MKFCPNCDIRLKKTSGSTKLECPKCHYAEGDTTKPEEEKISEEPQSDFMVLDENEGKDVLPTIEIECEKCGNNEAVWWSYKLGVLTNQQRNFIAVQNVVTLGVITHKV